MQSSKQDETKEAHKRHITIKIPKVKDKQRILKEAIEKQLVILKIVS